MNSRAHGPRFTANGVEFRLWAPNAKSVDVLLDGRAHPLQQDKDGWFKAEIAGVRGGARYRFRIDGNNDVPDPASAFQPEDIPGPSEVIDHSAYAWRATEWRGRPWEEAVVLEAHVGTFTAQGSYRAIIDKLDDLVATGITVLELMPLADFPGKRNWGYDGVLWYAPDSVYGRPEDLKALIDAAHERGLMVFLDVVYNHFGPEGNHIGQYAPTFFSDSHTPWGNAINYFVEQVRSFTIDNAVYWLREYRFDGLRLDAVHAIPDQGEIPMLYELSREVGKLAAETGRHLHLVLENDDNIAAQLDPTIDPHRGQYRAQWNDDYHHAWHVALTGETQGYYSDYATAPLQHVARSLGSGFVYQGEPSEHRGGEPRGEPSGELPPLAFINFLQNHDQIGNRALGDRLESLARLEAVEAALAITLLAPTVPMLFMGEEWGSQAPFPFFCDFHGDLAEAVRQGRRKEFAGAYEKYGDDVPDPLDESTFKSAVLNWGERQNGAGAKRLALVTELLAIRRETLVPRLRGAKFGDAQATEQGVLTADWRLGDGSTLRLAANLSDQPRDAKLPIGTKVWGDDWDGIIPPWAVSWRLEES